VADVDLPVMPMGDWRIELEMDLEMEMDLRPR
jgi:hypothetical protein